MHVPFASTKTYGPVPLLSEFVTSTSSSIPLRWKVGRRCILELVWFGIVMEAVAIKSPYALIDKLFKPNPINR